MNMYMFLKGSLILCGSLILSTNAFAGDSANYPPKSGSYETQATISFECVSGKRQVAPKATLVFVGGTDDSPSDNLYYDNAQINEKGEVSIRGAGPSRGDFQLGTVTEIEDVFAGKSQTHLESCGFFSKVQLATLSIVYRGKIDARLTVSPGEMESCGANPLPHYEDSPNSSWARVTPATITLRDGTFKGYQAIPFSSLLPCTLCKGDRSC